MQVNVDVGVVFEIALPEPTAGYRWEIAQLPDGFELVDSELAPSPRRRPGAQATRILRLVADAPGTYTLDLLLRQPWEPEPDARQTVVVHVH